MNLTPEQNERLVDYVNIYLTLRTKTAKELVDLALKHMPDSISLEYEQIIEELCSRVHPTWPEDEG